MSLYAAAAGIGATIGLVVSGLLADLISWRMGFFVNLPIGLGLMVAAKRHIGETPTHRGRFDLAGAITSTLGMVPLVFGIVRSTEIGWASIETLMSVCRSVETGKRGRCG